jgi:hypothetical protein
MFFGWGRLKGVSVEQARGEIKSISARLENFIRRPMPGPAPTSAPSRRSSRQLSHQPGVTARRGCARLLIACANLANLLAVRGAARAGNSRFARRCRARQIIRQLLIGNFVISIIGGARVGLRRLGRDALVAFAPPARRASAWCSLAGLAFTFLLTTFTTYCSGSGPRGSRADGHQRRAGPVPSEFGTKPPTGATGS